MRYLLDTDICIFIARRKPPAVLSRLRRLKLGDVGMSVITYLELVHGALNSARQEADLAAVGELSQLIPVEPLEASAAETYGRIHASLQRRGALLGAYDLIIAAHALSLGLTLVTSNTREFSRVPGLHLENWAA